MYEVLLTRLLSAVCWYYLAFVSISLAMFGMTVGALAVQLRPDLFGEKLVPRRLVQGSIGMAIALPISLMTMLAVPVDLSLAAETLYSFLFFSVIIAIPFFFSGVVVCLSLTRTHRPVGRVYCADLLGAGLGCLASVALLKAIDAPSGIFVISGLLFCSAALYASDAALEPGSKRLLMLAGIVIAAAALNSLTVHGIQPIWSKGHIDRRAQVLTEVWNPISKVRVTEPQLTEPKWWGPSPKKPRVQVEQSDVDIDNDADTPVMRFRGDLSQFEFLNYDVTSLGAQLRRGGTAAIIGVGGGRDVLTCAVNGFRRIVGVEVNSAIVGLMTNRLAAFSGFNKIPGFELYQDEGRSYLTRSAEKFDVIQASLVDTWAANAAGAMTLTENGLYTLEGWKVFYDHLRPGGFIAFTRWYGMDRKVETWRLFSVAWATLLSEGVRDPGTHLAVIHSDLAATLLASNRPLSATDMGALRSLSRKMEFEILYLPGQAPAVPQLELIAQSRTLRELTRLGRTGDYDYSPVFDSSPYFFNTARLESAFGGFGNPNLRALIFVFCFGLAAAALVGVTILLPLERWARSRRAARRASVGGVVYFIAIGLGFMLVEMGLIELLSIFLGQPVYSLVVVLAGLILSTGLGSLVSDNLPLGTGAGLRLPALAAAVVAACCTFAALPVTHHCLAALLWQRVAVVLALVFPCGFLMGFCFPIGLRSMQALKQHETLPWMWALNGAAATLGSFIAVFISLETAITTCIAAGAGCYLVASVALPRARTWHRRPARDHGRDARATFGCGSVATSETRR